MHEAVIPDLAGQELPSPAGYAEQEVRGAVWLAVAEWAGLGAGVWLLLVGWALLPLWLARRARAARAARAARGRLLLPWEPHRYAPEAGCAGSCWCAQPAEHPVHHAGTRGGKAAA